jgi:hypothetical protein
MDIVANHNKMVPCPNCDGMRDIRSKQCWNCKRGWSGKTEKTCTKCLILKPLTEYHKRGEGTHSQCKDCQAIWFRNNRYLIKYGVTSAIVDALLKEQDYRCAICGTKDEGRGYGYLHVDHNHATNEIRGMLCFDCNTGIGKFKDDPALLSKAIDYLKPKA